VLLFMEPASSTRSRLRMTLGPDSVVGFRGATGADAPWPLYPRSPTASPHHLLTDAAAARRRWHAGLPRGAVPPTHRRQAVTAGEDLLRRDTEPDRLGDRHDGGSSELVQDQYRVGRGNHGIGHVAGEVVVGVHDQRGRAGDEVRLLDGVAEEEG